MNSSFVYEWTDHYNGMFYIGYHKGSPDDGYIGSGKLFKTAYACNPHLFTREILAQGLDEKMIGLEIKLLKEVNAAENPRYYNLTNCKMPLQTGLKSDKHRKNLSLSHKGKTLSVETKEKLRQLNSGKTLSVETKEKLATTFSKKKWIRKNNNSLRVNIDQVDRYLHDGWELGRPFRNCDRPLMSEEYKKNHSAAMKTWWDNRKIEGK